ncbi:ABC transporter substrate-binding protein [Streptomyces sp. NRRL S-87]|uniref:ABC transporter substrate-binding protein n=1 Tax=Streptomyces sp. NRRL S-87 TaxID=1463920 RepID=UPI00068B2EBF|nr:ABC transporter substrate-binding protein [Streptomyces sp. NRRL S-87]
MTPQGGRRAYAAITVIAAGALALTGCGGSGGGDDGDDGAKDKDNAQRQQAQIKFGTAADSTGPAPAVSGAKTGGTLRVFQRDSFAHLDPGQIYVSDEMVLSQLIHRGLTGYKADATGKGHTVVGDLATDSGTPSDGGRTWKYTLKDGIKFADGTPITAKDVRHTFERLFSQVITEGPTYVQQWMADKPGAEYRKLLPDGPYKGAHLPASVLDTPDDKTIVFHFAKPKGDLPYALAMAGYSVVSMKGDTQKAYDKAPVTTGPYKIKEFKADKSMTLVRNENWDPRTDPIRTAYVDEFDITFNHQYEDSSRRLIADTGENRTALSFTNQVDATNLAKLHADAKLKARSVDGFQPYVGQMNINTSKPELKDVRVRRAIAYALPVSPFVRAYGGEDAMAIAGGLISPTVSGYAESDPFGKKKKPAGDPAKAKKLLEEAGKTGLKLTFGYINTPEGQQYSNAMAEGLKKAGFDVQRQEIPKDTYYDVISKVNNKYDIFHTAWGADWPSASTVIPPLYDGRQIQDGAQNYSQVNDPKVNADIDRINGITDAVQAAKEWNKVNEYLLSEVVNVVPTGYYKQVQIAGSGVGGVVYDDVIGGIDPRKLFLK